MHIEDWGIYHRADGRAIGFGTYRYASGRLVLKWRCLPPKFAAKYDCTKAWHKPCITQVLDNAVDVDNEIEAEALLDLID